MSEEELEKNERIDIERNIGHGKLEFGSEEEQEEDSNDESDSSEKLDSHKPNFPDFDDYIVGKYPDFFVPPHRIQGNQILLVSTSTKEHKQINTKQFRKKILQLELEKKKFKKFLPLPKNVDWIDIYAPNCEFEEVLLDYFETLFGVHKLTIEEILSTEASEKLEQIEKNYYHIILKERQSDAGEWKDSIINLLVFQDVIFSIHTKPLSTLSRVMYSTLFPVAGVVTSDWILYKFFDCVVNEFIQVVDAIYNEVNNYSILAHQLSGGGSDADLVAKFSRTNRNIALLRAQIMNKKDTLKSLTGEKAANLVLPNTLIYFHDVLDHISSMIQRLQLTGELLNNISSSYLANISYRIAVESINTNYVVKKMTILAAVIAPMTVVVGLWGMNVPVPGRDDYTPYGGVAWFCIILLGLLVWFCIANLYFYKRGDMRNHTPQRF